MSPCNCEDAIFFLVNFLSVNFNRFASTDPDLCFSFCRFNKINNNLFAANFDDNVFAFFARQKQTVLDTLHV